MTNKTISYLIFITLSLPGYAEDIATPCADIKNDEQRLTCYDQNNNKISEDITGTVLDHRIKQELSTINNSFSLTAHQPSYILPFAYVSNPNEAPFNVNDQVALQGAELDNLEVKFQISFRVPVNRKFFFDNSDLWFAYTQLSLWQLYNSGSSAPFRETNYEPELVWAFLVNKSYGDLKLTYLNFAVNHQSNGRSEPLSRSWNRITVESIWAYNNWVFSIRPWYRIPESSNDDDNPDIDDYIGHFDIKAGYKQNDHQFSSVFRTANGGDKQRSFYELGYSFEINRRFRGYVQFISGYGETLLDYNHRNKRFSIGIMLNDWF